MTAWHTNCGFLAKHHFTRWMFLAGLLFLVACQVTLIARYDPVFDQTGTALQKKMDTFLTELEVSAGRPEADYSARQSFYPEYLVDLRSLLIRAQSHEHNETTVQQLELMMDNVKNFQTLHQAGPIDSPTIEVNRNLFNQGWKAILTLELAKPRAGS